MNMCNYSGNCNSYINFPLNIQHRHHLWWKYAEHGWHGRWCPQLLWGCKFELCSSHWKAGGGWLANQSQCGLIINRTSCTFAMCAESGVKIDKNCLKVRLEHPKDQLRPSSRNLHPWSGGRQTSWNGGDGIGIGCERHCIADGLLVRVWLQPAAESLRNGHITVVWVVGYLSGFIYAPAEVIAEGRL